MNIKNLESWLEAHGFTFKEETAGGAYFYNVAPISKKCIKVILDYDLDPGCWNKRPELERHLKRCKAAYEWGNYGGGSYFNIYQPEDLDDLETYWLYANKSRELWAQLQHKYRDYEQNHTKHFCHRIKQIMNIYGRRYLAAAGRCI